MNNLKLKLLEIERGSHLSKDGIDFTECSFLTLEIDHKCENLKFMQDSLLVFEELQKSLQKTGKYLIFTCACGIADDAGWDLVDVTHEFDTVVWEFEYEKKYKYVFNKNNYVTEVEKIAYLIKEGDFPLVPDVVVFPEKYFETLT